MAQRKDKKLLLPRGYLSPTQLTLLETDEPEYIRRYIKGVRRDSNRFQEFGSTIARVLEGAEDGDPIADLLRHTVKRYKKPEHELRATLKLQGSEIELFGKPDSYDDEPDHSIEEYKTGKWKWTPAKVKKQGQTLFYATMVWINHKVLPKEIGLTWAQTEETEDGEIYLTGKVERFPIVYTTADVLSMMNRMHKAAKRIDELYRAEISDIFS